MEDLEIVFDPLPPDPLRQYITDRLSAFGIARTGVDDMAPDRLLPEKQRGRMAGRRCSASPGAAG